MGKKKKQKLLTSDFYRSLDKLRTATGVMALSKKDGGSNFMYEMAERRELGFKFPTLGDMHDCQRYGQIDPEFARVMSGHLCKDDLMNETQKRRVAENPCWSHIHTLHSYISASTEEFDDWLNAYKFEIDWGSIENILPTGQKMEEMFGHLETRLPYDKCLYIGKVNKDLTIYFNLSQQLMTEAIDHYNDELDSGNLSPSLMKDLGYSTSEYEEINSFGARVSDNNLKHGGLLPILHRWESMGVENIARANTSISYKGQFVFNPMSVILPLGITIKEMSGVGDEDDDGYEMSLLMDRYLHPTHDVTWAEKALSRNEYPDDPDRSSFHSKMGIEVLKYASVFLDPQFREFAVKEELHQGMTPEFIKQSKIIKQTNPIKTGADRPKFEHRVLKLNIPKGVLNPSGKGNRKEGTRLHSVRGHMLKTAKGKFVWRKAHWRGKEKFGVIKKEYKLPKQKAS
jgi:hypothetical protein